MASNNEKYRNIPNCFVVQFSLQTSAAVTISQHTVRNNPSVPAANGIVNIDKNAQKTQIVFNPRAETVKICHDFT